MVEFISVAISWLGIMALIGIALWAVPKLASKIKPEDDKTKNTDTQNIADE